VIGTAVAGVDGADLGTVRDVYRSGGADVFVVDGGVFGEFDVPAVRDFIRVFAPRRGEIVVDAEALDLQAPKRHGEGEPRPKAPRRRTRRPKAAQEADRAAADAAPADVAAGDVAPDDGSAASSVEAGVADAADAAPDSAPADA
jgi:hypothetical protein